MPLLWEKKGKLPYGRRGRGGGDFLLNVKRKRKRSLTAALKGTPGEGKRKNLSSRKKKKEGPLFLVPR